MRAPEKCVYENCAIVAAKVYIFTRKEMPLLLASQIYNISCSLSNNKFNIFIALSFMITLSVIYY